MTASNKPSAIPLSHEPSLTRNLAVERLRVASAKSPHVYVTRERRPRAGKDRAARRPLAGQQRPAVERRASSLGPTRPRASPMLFRSRRKRVFGEASERSSGRLTDDEQAEGEDGGEEGGRQCANTVAMPVTTPTSHSVRHGCNRATRRRSSGAPDDNNQPTAKSESAHGIGKRDVPLTGNRASRATGWRRLPRQRTFIPIPWALSLLGSAGSCRRARRMIAGCCSVRPS